MKELMIKLASAALSTALLGVVITYPTGAIKWGLIVFVVSLVIAVLAEICDK